MRWLGGNSKIPAADWHAALSSPARRYRLTRSTRGQRLVAVRPFRQRPVLVEPDGGPSVSDRLPGPAQANIGAVREVGLLGRCEPEFACYFLTPAMRSSTGCWLA